MAPPVALIGGTVVKSEAARYIGEMGGTTLEGLGKATIDYEGDAFQSQRSIGVYDSPKEALAAAKQAYEALPRLDRDNHVHVIAEDSQHKFHVVQLREDDFTDAQLGDLNVSGFAGRAWIIDAEGDIGIVRQPDMRLSVSNISAYAEGTRPDVPGDQFVATVQRNGEIAAGTYGTALKITEPQAMGVLVGGRRS